MITNKLPIFILFALILLWGCTAIYNPATQKREYYFIDEDSEVMMGNNMASDIQRKNKIFSDKILQSYLNRIGQSIVLASDRSDLEYHFYILDDDQINAFALPGGHIFVNKGLIDKTNDHELAFVLGHEIGHVSARHSVKRLQSALGVNLLLGIALRDPDHLVLKQAVGVVYDVVALGYSRQDEFLADSLGVKYSLKAGYDPKAAFSLFKKMEGEGKTNNQLVFLMSHPPIKKRVEKIKTTLDELKLPTK